MVRERLLSKAGLPVRRRLKLACALSATVASVMLMAPRATWAIKPAEKFKPAKFKYVGGTENLTQNCVGGLEVNSKGLVYDCPQGSVKIPYDSIVVMEYRSNVNRDLRRMHLPWVFQPWGLRQRSNRYFTIVYSQEGRRHAIVLDVPPKSMQPYFAEIDLQSGRRINVENHEKYY